MAILADIRPEHDVLEPSAGTGAIIREIVTYTHTVTAVEINYKLASVLINLFPSHDIRVKNLDFLECNGDLGKFDRIVMNPPFQNADDIKHIQHALTMLRPGGKLVAICANGPRQQEKLQPLADTWEELPEGTFKDQGTGVRTVLLTIDAPETTKLIQGGLF
jgi:16S rRNA G1207 methylase RsmC